MLDTGYLIEQRAPEHQPVGRQSCEFGILVIGKLVIGIIPFTINDSLFTAY